MAYNHSEIQWKSVVTDHFIINYYDKTEPAVYATWKIAEECYDNIADLFAYTPKRKITISLADHDDYSNGWADPSMANIMIWVIDSRFDLRGNTTWLRNVINHELTHIISLENDKALQVVHMSVNLGYSTPTENISLTEPFARTTAYPMWFIEGIAQLGTAINGNDCWDSRRDMLLRTAVLSDKLLTLEEMSHFNHDSRGNESVYNQGFSFLRYIAEIVGMDVVLKIFRDGASTRINFPTYFREISGNSLDEMYDRWKKNLKKNYLLQVATDSSVQVTYNRGFYNLEPHFSNDGKWWGWFSSGRDDGNRSDLIISLKGSTKKEFKIPYAHTSWCFSSDSRFVYFIKSRDPDKYGSYFNDLYKLDLKNGRIIKLTDKSRIYEIASSPVNNQLAAVLFNNGAFSLQLFDENSKKFKKIDKGNAGEPFIDIAWSPVDSSKLVVSRVVDGRSRMYIYTLNDTQVVPLSFEKGQEESPFWAKDGRIYFSADYTGIFTIYSCNPDKSDLKRHCNVTGGAFSPVVDGTDSLCFVGFESTGFSIARKVLAGESVELTEHGQCSFKPLPVPSGKITIKPRKYEPRYGRSRWGLDLFGLFNNSKELFSGKFNSDFDSLQYIAGASLYSFRTDPLMKKGRSVGVFAGVEGLKTDAPLDTGRYSQNLLLLNGSYKLQKNTFEEKSISKNHEKEISNISRRFYAQSATVSSGKANDTATDASYNVFVIQPQLSVYNSENLYTYGLDCNVSLVNVVYPRDITGSVYMERQFTRTLSGRLGGNLQIFPYLKTVAGTIPLNLMWSDMGYYNKDIGYNLNGYKQALLSTGVEFLPQATNPTKDSGAVISDYFADISLFKGIPLGKHSTLQAFLNGRYTSYSQKVYTAMFDDNCSEIFQGSFTLNAVFPIARNINRGSTYYFDAFYGEIGYTLLTVVNDRYFTEDNRFSDFIQAPYITDNGIAAQIVSAKLTLGHYKSYMFFRTFSFTYNFELLRNYHTFTLNADL
jgi:hypothetical protein